eukprot:10218962-Alexandrium_andersonii.AAC.1
MSVADMKHLGTVVDFGPNLATFRLVDGGPKVIILERAQSGHLLLDVSEDLLRDAASGPPEVTAWNLG